MQEVAKEMENFGIKESDNHDQTMIREDNKGSLNINGGKRIIIQQQKTSLRTPADIYEHPSFYSFIIDMPGIDAQNIKVKVENGILHVSGKKKNKHIIGEPTGAMVGYEEVKVLRLERRRARYMRKFNLAEDADCEDVKAAYKEGVLSITVAKNNTNKPSSTLDVEVEDSKLNSLTSVSIS